MTGTATGRWVGVTLADGSVRYDWLPDDQPPSPDGTPGQWHVVGAPGEPGRWEWRESRPVATTPLPFFRRPLVVSYRTAIVGVVTALTVLAAIVLTFATAGREDSPAARPDLDFPKHSGAWTLYAITVDRASGTGAFTGRATVGYTGEKSGPQNHHVVVDVFRGRQKVGQLSGSAADVRRGGYATVDLGSRDDWLPDVDGFTFR